MTDTRPVVLDNTVLTNFAQVDCAQLVTLLSGGSALTTAAVMREYRQGVARGSVPDGAWEDLRILELGPEEAVLCERFPSSLGLGERSCLAVASHREGVLATDDLQARKLATSQGVTVTGTVGILIGCVKKGLVDLGEANRLLGAMIEHGYHSPVDRLDEFM